MYVGRKFQFHSLTCSCLDFSAPLIEEMSFPICIFLPPLPQINWPYVCVYFWTLYFIPCLFLCQYHTVAMSIALSSKVRERGISSSVLPYQDLSGYLRTFDSIQILELFVLVL